MFRLVAHIHLSDIGCLDWEKQLGHTRCRMLRMSVNGVSTIFSFASLIICVPLGCRHPFIKYWQPLLPKTTVTCSLPHPENERPWSINSWSDCIFGNQGIALIFAVIKKLLIALIGKNTIEQRYNTNSKLMDIASSKACNHISLVVENAILISYY